MKHFILFLLLGFVSMSGAEVIKPGVIAYENDRLFLAKDPINTIFTTDSVKIAWSVFCKNGLRYYDTTAVHDTIYVTLGHTVVHADALFYRGEKIHARTSSSPICTNEPGCYELFQDVPPVLTDYTAFWENGLINTNGGPGTIVVLEMPYYTPVRVIDFDMAGKYDPDLPYSQLGYVSYVVFWDPYEVIYL